MKKQVKMMALLLAAAVLTVAFAACGGKGDEGSKVSGNTYVYKDASYSGEEDGMDEVLELFKGIKYVFKEDGTGSYQMSFLGATIDMPFTYKQEGDTVTVTLQMDDEMEELLPTDEESSQMIFTVSGDTITYTESSPVLDEEGNEVEGSTEVMTLVYTKETTK